jgi:hypothetical protein
MLTRTAGVSHVVEAALTGLAQVTRPLRLSLVAPLLGPRRTVTGGTTDTVWPTQGSDGLNAVGVVETRWHGSHGARLA